MERHDKTVGAIAARAVSGREERAVEGETVAVVDNITVSPLRVTRKERSWRDALAEGQQIGFAVAGALVTAKCHVLAHILGAS